MNVCCVQSTAYTAYTDRHWICLLMIIYYCVRWKAQIIAHISEPKNNFAISQNNTNVRLISMELMDFRSFWGQTMFWCMKRLKKPHQLNMCEKHLRQHGNGHTIIFILIALVLETESYMHRSQYDSRRKTPLQFREQVNHITHPTQ